MIDRMIDNELNWADSSTSFLIFSVKIVADPETGASNTNISAYLMATGITGMTETISPKAAAGI